MIFDKGTGLDLGSEELSTEAQALIIEAAMLDTLTDEELGAFCESHSEVQSVLREQILLEKNIVRFDKKTKLNRATKMAVFQIARQRKDPKFKKLVTVWRMERALEAFLVKKYWGQAARMARQAMNNASKSKSNVIKKVAAKVNSQLNKPAKVNGSKK